MIEKQPRVTVLMPAFNAGKYIAEAIQSVLDQDFTDFELLIVEDGSTDNTKDIINQFHDPRIRSISQPKQLGVSRSLNKGLSAAAGYYIARFDADDICFPQRLSRQVNFLDQNDEYILVGADAEYISENGDHLFDFHCMQYDYEQIHEKIYENCPFIHSGVMYKKEAILRTGGYSIYAHNFEDYLLWVNIIKIGKCCNLPGTLLKVRFNPDSVTIDEKWRGKAFRKLKMEIIKRGSATEKEGKILLAILKKQEKRKIKESSYHALCSKKFLIDNFQPAKARKHAVKAIGINPVRLDNYILFLTSYLPKKWISWLRTRIQIKNY